jgi:hypothetical protein
VPKADIPKAIVGAESGQAHGIIRVGGIMAASVSLTMRRVMMRSYVEAGIIIAACGSAIFWFMSAICRLPTMKPGADEIDHGELSKVLQRMNRLNFFAAGLMGVTALLAALARYLG